MLIDLWDQVAGRLSRKWLMGRRFVIDFRDANERRIAVVELPEGSFSFDLRTAGDVTELVMVSDMGQRVLATFKDFAAAERSAKRVRIAMVRPFKKIVFAALGVLIVIFAFDLATTPRAMRTARPTMGQGATQEQMSAELRSRMMPTPAGAAANANAGQPTSAVVKPESFVDAQSSPEAQAAIRMLKGK